MPNGTVNRRMSWWRFSASKANARRCAEEYRGEKDKIRRDNIKHWEQRNEKIFLNLIQYAERYGKPPHELVAIFGVRDRMDDMSEHERRAWYEHAVQNVDSLRPCARARSCHPCDPE